MSLGSIMLHRNGYQAYPTHPSGRRPPRGGPRVLAVPAVLLPAFVPGQKHPQIGERTTWPWADQTQGSITLCRAMLKTRFQPGRDRKGRRRNYLRIFASRREVVQLDGTRFSATGVNGSSDHVFECNAVHSQLCSFPINFAKLRSLNT